MGKQSVFRSIPHDSNDCPWALLMVIANRPFPVSHSSFIYPPVPPGVPFVVLSLCPGRHLYSLCPGRHLCPGVPVCDFSLSVPGVIYIPCVPLSRSSFISPFAPRRPCCSCVPVSRSSFIFPVSRSSFVSRCPGLYIHSFFSFVFFLYFFPILFFFFFSLFRFLDFLVFFISF